MELSINEIKEKLTGKGLKITPQRMAILEAVYSLGDHPTAEKIIEYIRKTHPGIATGTVYKVLETLVRNGIIKKVKTENDIMRYDGVMSSHHHLYCSESDKIEDYIDRELDELLNDYFQRKGIPHFRIEEIKLQINGRFNKF